MNNRVLQIIILDIAHCVRSTWQRRLREAVAASSINKINITKTKNNTSLIQFIANSLQEQQLYLEYVKYKFRKTTA